MENFDNMNQNKVSDEELDQITGGKNLFDIFTADFRGERKKPTTLELHPEDEEDTIKLTTLEMRDNPTKKAKNTKKIFKL